MKKLIGIIILGCLIFGAQALYVHTLYSKKDTRNILQTCLDYKGGKACYKRDCELYRGKDYCRYKECIKYGGGKACSKTVK